MADISLASIPDLCRERILSFLDLKDQITLTQCCRALYRTGLQTHGRLSQLVVSFDEEALLPAILNRCRSLEKIECDYSMFTDRWSKYFEGEATATKMNLDCLAELQINRIPKKSALFPAALIANIRPLQKHLKILTLEIITDSGQGLFSSDESSDKSTKAGLICLLEKTFPDAKCSATYIWMPQNIDDIDSDDDVDFDIDEDDFYGDEIPSSDDDYLF